MMEDRNINSVYADVLDENNAQEVFKRLEELDNQRLVIASRWVWELIQNARGTMQSQTQLQIEIALIGNDLFFRHNGAPFKDREIAHLILHGSTKHDPGDIGRFGTGFITTHLLSRRVQIRGKFANGKAFDFVLNREGANASDLQKAMKKSRDEFIKSLEAPTVGVPEPYTTEYAYPLSESVREVVVEGLNALRLSAAYIFAFNPTLRLVKITTDDGSEELTAQPLDPLWPDTVRLGLLTRGKKSEEWILTAGNASVTAAMVVNSIDTTPIVRLPAMVPRLFIAFPLSGTQNLSLPLVLNSENFVPREQRDGIFLGVGTNENNRQNQDLFIAGCERIVVLVALAAEQSWLNIPALTQLQRFECPEWADKEWLHEQIRSIVIEGLRTKRLLRTISGKLVTPASAWIPVAGGQASSLD